MVIYANKTTSRRKHWSAWRPRRFRWGESFRSEREVVGVPHICTVPPYIPAPEALIDLTLSAISLRRFFSSGPAPLRTHLPVLLNDVIQALIPADGEWYIDGTFGNGGYTRKILVVALDRDPAAYAAALSLALDFPGRLLPVRGRFGDLLSIMNANFPQRKFHGAVFDLGLCSDQISDADRGFAYSVDGPLDMRMDGADRLPTIAPQPTSSTSAPAAPRPSLTAFHLVNSAPESALADIIYTYGEDRLARKFARAIVQARTRAPIRSTAQLKDVLVACVPAHRRLKGDDGVFRHPAQRTFQALRIAVNDELNELRRALHASEHLLHSGGRLVVVSFHSLEDTVAKQFFDLTGGRRTVEEVVSGVVGEGAGRRDVAKASASFVGKRKVVKPERDEVQANPRARSAKLRSAMRTDASPMYPLEVFLEDPLYTPPHR
ncbi:hypothetical protein HDU93_009712 [Gonapodya sp. JEL0774]|nr:hypothetical protein HDU93_009712 [Gonapodya sp. JEL0774]